MTEADQIIAKLGLQPHPEGGWYRQTWVGPDLHIGTNTRASGTATRVVSTRSIFTARRSGYCPFR